MSDSVVLSGVAVSAGIDDAAAFDAMMELVFEKRPFLPYPILHATEQAALRNAQSNSRLWDAQLKDRYLLVKHHDRVGRMADTLEYSDVALPLARFSPALLAELHVHAAELPVRQRRALQGVQGDLRVRQDRV